MLNDMRDATEEEKEGVSNYIHSISQPTGLSYDNILTIPDTTYKTEMKLGNLIINITKRFNWFQKKMWKICFGFDEIKDL